MNNTLQSEINISGKTLMGGQETQISIVKNNLGRIRFLNNSQEIDASVNNVISTQNSTVIGNQNAQIRLIEHFMAACAFANLNGVDVMLDGNELPIFDGSSKVWYETFTNVLELGTEIEKINFESPISYKNDRTEIVLLPSDTFKVTYMVNMNHKDLSNKWYTTDFTNTSEIIEARTFGYLNDLEKLQAAGFALGVSIDNTVGLTENDGYTTELRSDLEPIKHKILDLVGDLMLTGHNPLGFNAHIIAKEAGHSSHFEFAKILKTQLKGE